jgi:hypothetical protein
VGWFYRVERVLFDAWHRERLNSTTASGGGVDTAADDAADDGSGSTGIDSSSSCLSSLVPPLFLLRVFVRLPELLARADVGDAEAGVLAHHIGGLIKFMARNRDDFLGPSAYAKTSHQYAIVAEAAMRGIGTQAAANKLNVKACYE